VKEFIRDRCAPVGSVRLTDFRRALQTNLSRTEIIAQLAQLGYSTADVAGQLHIVGLSLRESSPIEKLRSFIEQNCVRFDGLEMKLADLVRAAGMRRNQVVHSLTELGFAVVRKDKRHYVEGLGLKEPCYK
jgi:hypothetical protein